MAKVAPIMPRTPNQNIFWSKNTNLY